MPTNKVEFYVDADGKHRWRFKAKNGEIIAVSSEGYETLQGCRDGWNVVVNAVENLYYDEHEFDKDGSPRTSNPPDEEPAVGG